MEKKKPHYLLTEIHRLIASGCWRFTHTARSGALDLGLDEARAVTVVAELAPGAFYKSMTSHTDHQMWHDVYHTQISDGRLAYIKLTVLNGLIVVSFKEK